jgi:hypothetical protein
MALHLVKRLGPLTGLVRDGRWAERGRVPVGDLDGATIGIVGYGRIGRRVGELAGAFGMRVLAHDPFSPPPPEVDTPDLGALAEASDVVTLHAPLTDQTRHLVGEAFLTRVRPGRSWSTAAGEGCSTSTPRWRRCGRAGWPGSVWTCSTPSRRRTTPCSTTPTWCSPPISWG